ncbi:ATP-binding protein [Paenibacillus sp. N3/727]|uniref:ATP-binding protein n=1 Tax=Paenibacillus sp. N3/727 TaxID=2925845 RepID=UPI001F532BBD|nr:ATP-binding protein [Paenibacillus sp. N3/727]UNK17455.1 ATP-binding protein [Paenibacillus sp. N3/727]
MLSEIRGTELEEMGSFHPNQLVRTKYENILENLDSGIILFDSDGVLAFVNVQMAKLLGVPRKSLAGCTLTELLRHPQLTRFKKKKILRLFRETIFHRKRFHELLDEYGKSWLITMTYGDQMEGDFLISVKDVSDFKQIEQTAYQNDKLAMLGKISASIAHEIRNPLTSIRGFIQLLRPHLMSLGKDEYARIILTEIDRANDIIYEFLNSSKPSAPQTTVIPVTSLLKEVVLLTESEALMKGCQISLHLDERDPTYISVDVKQIKQVLLNLIKNALDAIDEKLDDPGVGMIEIGMKHHEKHVSILVSDNGGGMDQNTLNHLFNPFFTTKEGGTGLGLSVSYRIIKNHGGSIAVESHVGTGTEFEIMLPKMEGTSF